jgi:hypothetical protein
MRPPRFLLGGLRTKLVSVAFLALLAPHAARAQTHLLIVSGLGGEPKYAEMFRKWGLALVDAARTRYAVPDSEVVYLAEAGAADSRISGVSTKENIERTLQRFAQRTGAGDQIVIVLVGHGSGESEDSRISLPGPDMTARDFARVLDKLTAQQVAFIDMTSASGDMLPVVSGPNRVVITATKSSFERNESQFAGFFVTALTGDGADVDKDGRVSLLEAFRYAAAETKRHYEQDTRLQTEHAQLDDDGDKKGSADPDPRVVPGQGDGALARRMFLGGATYASRGTGSAGARPASNDPRVAGLYKERFAIEEQIEALKRRKTTLGVDAYDDELEKLLVGLALKSREIRQVEGRE